MFVEPFPRTGAKYQAPLDRAGHPVWSPKGDELILNIGPGGRSATIGVTTAPRFAFGRPIDLPRAGRYEPNPALFRRNLDPMPNGERLLGVITPSLSPGAPELSNRITVVLTWFDELRQRVPVR